MNVQWVQIIRKDEIYRIQVSCANNDQITIKWLLFSHTYDALQWIINN